MTTIKILAVSYQEEAWVTKHHQFGGYLGGNLRKFAGMPNVRVFLVTNENNNTHYFIQK